mgnify:CR=1 FL=1
MRNNTIAIDFGSVNTVIYQLGAGVVLSEPTVIALTASEKPTVKAVGTEAKKLIGKTAETTRIVFPVAEGQVADIKNATLTLENFLNKITLRKLSLRPKVVLSVPCGLENSEIKKYEKLANITLVTKIEHKFLLNIARKMDEGKQVLCHRDLQLPNIMYDGKEIKFVDFEYSGFSSILWEIGNFTAELELNDEQINKFIELYKDISYREIIEGQLMSNYVWALWGWIYDSIDLGRNYLTRFHHNLNYLMKSN